MTAPEIISFAVVLFVGLPAMLRNWTAAGLVASFVIMQTLWVAIVHGYVSGPIPLQFYLLCDFIVITIIFLKGPPIERVPASGLVQQGQKMWLELSRSDKIVLAIFLPCWAAYALDIGDVARYWILWTLGLLQFFVAGAEAFAAWRRGRARASEAHPADWFLRQRLAGHEW